MKNARAASVGGLVIFFIGKHAPYHLFSKPLAGSALLPPQKQLKLSFQFFVALFRKGARKCKRHRPFIEVENLLQHGRFGRWRLNRGCWPI
jgi:hypothetical protein